VAPGFIDENGKPVPVLLSAYVLRGSLPRGAEDRIEVAKFHHEIMWAEPDGQPRWRIREGCYWGNVARFSPHGFTRIPVRDLPRIPYYPPAEYEKLPPEQTADGRRLAMESLWLINEPNLPEEESDYDFLPARSDGAYLFALKGKRLTVRDMALDLKSKTIDLYKFSAVAKRPRYEVEAGWSGPFVVYGGPDRFDFVTRAGAVYAWEAPGTPGQRMRAVWTDAARPERAVNATDEGRRVYAFTRAAEGGEAPRPAVYFELRGADRPTAYRQRRRPAAVPEPLADVYPFVEALRADGRLAGKE
jgi:hypothetical protein